MKLIKKLGCFVLIDILIGCNAFIIIYSHWYNTPCLTENFKMLKKWENGIYIKHAFILILWSNDWSIDEVRTLGALNPGSNSKGHSVYLVYDAMWKGIVSHQRTIALRARQFSGLGLNIDGAGWYRLMYIHRASRSPRSNQRERYLSLVLRQEKRESPLTS